MNLQNIRTEFLKGKLNKTDMPASPFNAFKNWLSIAIKSNVPEPTAMTLSSIGKDGTPSSRIVLLKEYNEQGFSFFSNYSSRKGTEIAYNPNVSLLFFWPQLEQQIRIEGHAQKLDEATSDNYFQNRPENSRIGAWASPQSQVVPNRAYIEQLYDHTQEILGQSASRRPEFWGGYIVKPRYFEFWQGRANRLHDRLCYEKSEDNNWKMLRLAP